MRATTKQTIVVPSKTANNSRRRQRREDDDGEPARFVSRLDFAIVMVIIIGNHRHSYFCHPHGRHDQRVHDAGR
jgi:hypothetical protein